MENYKLFSSVGASACILRDMFLFSCNIQPVSWKMNIAYNVNVNVDRGTRKEYYFVECTKGYLIRRIIYKPFYSLSRLDCHKIEPTFSLEVEEMPLYPLWDFPFRYTV